MRINTIALSGIDLCIDVVGRRRLLKLSGRLRDVADEKIAVGFDMGHWGERNWDWDCVEPLANPLCNTTACALGHAAMIPSFRSQGLKLVWSGRRLHETGRASVFFGDAEGTEAGEAFFRITEDVARALFGGSFSRGHRTSRQVAGAIERLVRAAEKVS